MTGPSREWELMGAMVALVDSLLDDFDVVDLLTELTERCVHLLDVESAGLLLMDPQRKLRLMTATSSRTRDLELFQLQGEEGPCLDSFASGEQVIVADLNAELVRWPRFAAAGLAAGFLSVHALPMRAAGITVGALGLFGTRVGALATEDLAVGQALAHVATVAIMQERATTPDAVLPRLSGALTGQIVVEQAKGLLRERLGVSIDEASRLLRAYARSRNAHLSDVSRQMVSQRQIRLAIVEELAEAARRDASTADRGSP